MNTGEKAPTQNQVVEAVCLEMGITVEQITKSNVRSTASISAAKAICTYLLRKVYRVSSNSQTMAILGYKAKSPKPLQHNIKSITDAIDIGDQLIVPHLNNIIAVLSGTQPGRVYVPGELSGLRIIVGKPTGDAKEALQGIGVYPFVIRANNQLNFGYGIDNNGLYIGQSHEEYKAAIM